MKNELKVGQKVWYLPPSYRNTDRVELKEAIITKIGRKYFELDNKYYGKFDIETLKMVNNYNHTSRVYLSDIEYYEEKEKDLNWGKVKRIINSTYLCPFTNEQLKKILEIICTD